MMAVCGQSGRTMDISFVLLLMTIVRVQGYYSDLNGTNFENYIHKNDASNVHGHQQKHFNQRQFDQIFDHYRNDGKPSRREPRFISFQTKDDNIEVEIDFAIPFLSIPVKRSLSGAMGTLQSFIKGIPMANINVGAVLLTGIVIVGGAMIGGIGRLINGGNFIEVYGNSIPWLKSDYNKRQKHDGSAEENSGLWTILDHIDKALLKYDFDTTACTQRAICWYIKDSLANVQENKGSNIDRLINGLSSSEWALQLISNTSWNDAVRAGRKGLNCETTFQTCKLSPNNLESFAKNLIKFATRRK